MYTCNIKSVLQFKTILVFICFLLLSFCFSCKEFIEVDPPKTQTISATIYKNDAGATSAIRGIYIEMVNTGTFATGGLGSVAELGGLSSDEFINYAVGISWSESFYTNSLLTTNVFVELLWQEAYKYIYYANSVLEGLTKSKGITPLTRSQLEGEAKFIRAFYYFYLINLFGDVPLITTLNYHNSKVAPRVPTEQVYQQIITDLTEAQSLLVSDYSLFKDERVRANKWAATALLARVFLYKNDWANAEIEATSVINNATLYALLPNLNEVFLKNSQEAIWQLMPSAGNNASGVYFILTASPYGKVSLKEEIFNTFEANDKRKTNWVGTFVDSDQGKIYYYPYKYQVIYSPETKEYPMMLRLAEQHLIRAEARAQQGDIAGAQADLNEIRNRADLPNTTANDRTTLLQAIMHERRVELFAEWGHRWFDLKRTGKATEVLQPLKAPNWQPDDQLYPIPQSERSANPFLTQNNGY